VHRKETMTKVKVQAPSSTSNLGSGFDVYGLALDVMYDVVEVELTDERGIFIELEGVGKEITPTVPSKNSAGRAALQFLEKSGGFKIKVMKGIPPASGLGGSGATAVATTIAINHLLGTELTRLEMVDIARKSEIASPHADNVAPSLYGGFTVIRSYHPLDVIALPSPRGVEFALALPSINRTTKEARHILPKMVKLSKIVSNVGAASAIVVGVLLSDARLIGLGLNSDEIVEPVRAHLYPGYPKAKEAALTAGAYGVNLSGAGPATIAVVDPGKVDAVDVANAMRKAYENEGLECHCYISKPTKGAKILR
jgi:homoserine kinase